MERAEPRKVHDGTCLIVEDSSFDCEKMTRIMQKAREGMRIKVASSLRAARRVLEKGDLSLILLDNNLPDGLGADFVQELASDPKLSGIPVIMVSDWPSPFMWEKAAAAGVAYVLSKTEFDGRYVHAALEGKQARRLN